ncbi:MAG: hypothetical protein K5756_06010 [Clostridiales bacterium]|nr:hypothetical protein [Clostridiales bacterium]
MKTAKRIISVILSGFMLLLVAPPVCLAGAADACPAESCGICGTVCCHCIATQAAVDDEHDWDDGVETTSPTCTEKGVMTYTCRDCSAKKTEDIKLLGHDPQIAPYVKPTCTEMGYAPFICTRCGETISKTDPEDPLGHDYKPVYTWAEDNSSVTAEMTCTRCGDVSITETVNARRKVIAEPTCAQEGEALYTSDGFACKAFYVQTKTEAIAKLPHDTVRIRQKSPTCTEEGIDTYCICNNCHGIFEDEAATIPLKKPPVLPKLPHKLYEIPAVEPTCTQDGVVAYWRCEMCGQYFADQNGTPAMFPLPSIPAKGHIYEPVYTWADDNSSVTATLTCTRCGDTTVTETVGVTMKVTVEPTCTQDGEAIYTSGAFACKSFYVQTKNEPIAPLGHDPQIAPYVYPTCTEPGYAPFICTRCGKIISKTDPEDPLGHDYKPVYTWAEDNSSVTATLTCTRCGDTTVTETVGVTMKVTVEPTCTQDGEAIYTSDGFACKAFYVQTKTEHIAALGHDRQPVYTWADDNSSVTATLTCTRCGDTTVTETVGVTMKVTVEPTCTQEGEATYTSGAFACKSFYVQTKTEVLLKLPHDTVRIRQKSPTCTEEGIDTYCICNNCHGIFEDEAATIPLDKPPVLPKLPHKLYEVTGTDPTCTVDGVVHHWRCEMCGQYFSDGKETLTEYRSLVISAKGHTPGETVIENKKPATYKADGSYEAVIYCTECGAEISRETVVIPMPKHDHVDRDNDGYCDQCEQMMTGGEHCDFCGKIHTGTFSKLIIFFHKIFAFLKRK